MIFLQTTYNDRVPIANFGAFAYFETWPATTLGVKGGRQEFLNAIVVVASL